MTDPDLDELARAIFDARFADEKPRDRPQWDRLPEAARDVWRRCANAARESLANPMKSHDKSKI